MTYETKREKMRARIEQSMERAPLYAARVRRVGVDREVDNDLLAEAHVALGHINLVRYPKDAELKELIRAARIAVADAYEAHLDLVYVRGVVEG